MIVTVALIVALIVTIALTFGKFARSEGWRATVTPLASIIGSGFLICGPLLAREFGSAALGAMAVLLAIAYAAGAVIRFNIVHVENHLAVARFNDPVAWLARITQGVLALAYAVSVAYYLKLLAEFSLKPFTIAPATQPLAANVIVTVLIVLMTLLALGGSLRKVEHLAHGTVSVKIGIIAGLLAALAISWVTSGPGDPLPPVKLSFASLPMLLGLLITVQGFETSRYLGHSYSPELRIKTMRHAQWFSSAIYLAFIALLTPFLTRRGDGGGRRYSRHHGTDRAGAWSLRPGGRGVEPVECGSGRLDRFGWSHQRGVAPQDQCAAGVRAGGGARHRDRVVDGPVSGRGPVVARICAILRASMRPGIDRVVQDRAGDAVAADRLRRDRAGLPGGRSSRGTRGGMMKIPDQARDILREHGPTAPVWRRRVAILGGAVTIGLVALMFAHLADWAGERFVVLAARWWWAPLILTPLGYATIAGLTARFAPAARGSGIPQVMAATGDPDHAMGALVSAKTVIVKLALTIGTLLVGASTGREGPTVQVAASIMGYAHRLMAIPLRASVFIAGGAAGVAAAFNTPLAGVALRSRNWRRPMNSASRCS